MTVKEVISSGLLESYVLGTASAEETRLVQDLCKTHPELLKEIEQIESDLIRLSERSSQPVNAALKEKIAAQLNFKEQDAKVVPLEKDHNTTRLRLYQFATAASIVLFITSFTYNILLQNRLSKVSGELTQLSAANTILAGQMRIQEASLNAMSTKFQVVSDPKMKMVALNGMNYLDKRSAAVHWNSSTGEVYFNAAQLPESPTAKQYQLWAIVNGKPVDAGMIEMAGAGAVFQKMKSITGAQAFAVTIENMGGSPVPTMPAMCLLGNVQTA